tara:strand:- start:127 stop:303 length:177 start_codon:yes stop_codon:yes gene_type:complete
MSDDLVTRLRELDRLHSYADKCEAASRIEKLEAALRRILLHSRETWECKIAKEALDAK